MSPSVQNSSQAPAPQAEKPQSRAAMFAQIALGVVAVGYLETRIPGLIRAAVAFIITLSILVFVHEWGHYQFGRWAGMKINRFALGFPPFIYTKRKNNIDYSIGALPIGGMVDIAGLGSEEEMVNTAKGEPPAPKRDLSRPFGEKHYQDASLLWRFLVIFAGPLMNFIFAILVAIGFFCIVGSPNMERANFNRVGLTMNGSPAAKAGVQSGDLVVGVNGTATSEDEKIIGLIRGSKGNPVTLRVLRNDQPVEVTVKPEMKPSGTDKSKLNPTIGILFEADPRTIRYERIGLVPAVQQAFQVSYGMTTQVLGLIKRALTLQLTDVDKSSIGGPVKIAQRAGQASREGGLRESVLLSIGLSMNLGLMNLLPLPALDGGRIMFLGYELVARRPFNPKWEGIVHAAGMLMLLSFMIFITLRDVNAGALLERFMN
ncbi:MAG TPA: M50 family metallopeptidase [Abditibacterium sp.]|jgi:regulator of sigma E protease